MSYGVFRISCSVLSLKPVCTVYFICLFLTIKSQFKPDFHRASSFFPRRINHGEDGLVVAHRQQPLEEGGLGPAPPLPCRVDEGPERVRRVDERPEQVRRVDK